MRCPAPVCRLLAAVLVALSAFAGGCANLRVPRIDPTGERIFVEPPIQATPVYRDVPGPWSSADAVQLIISPCKTVAPIGSEVVVLAGIRDRDGYLRTNERIEWMLSPGGVGQFVDLNRSTVVDYLLLDLNRPRVIDATRAVGSTSRYYLRLTRGTPTTIDDVNVLRGQAWISVTSPVEGTSYVTAWSPGVQGWSDRKETATIQWIDAEYGFPAPAIVPAGKTQMLVTSVSRYTDHQPLTGWLVRYEVAGGPPAGFAPDGARAVEVPVGPDGRATAEMFQPTPTAGTTQVNIQVIRPADARGERTVVGNGSTMVTWTAPKLEVRKTGPAAAGVGSDLRYQITVSNPGGVAAEGVQLVDEIPTGAEYVSSNPPAQVAGSKLTWIVGNLPPGRSQSFQVDLRARQGGTLTSCAEVTSSGGLRARSCATTTVGTARLDVRMQGPTSARVGEKVRFEITVTNLGQSTATGLLIKDRFDPGLKHEAATSPIERDLEDLAPGASHRISVEFLVEQAGALRQQVEVTGAGGLVGSAETTVTATASTTPPPSAPPTTPPTTPPGQARLSVRLLGPSIGTVGQKVRFTIETTNTGNRRAESVKLATGFDPGLNAVTATDGFRFEGNDLAWDMGALEPGATAQRVIECECKEAGARACGRATVTAGGGLKAEDEWCMRIQPGQTGPTPGPATTGAPKLTMSASALREPVALGKEVTYEIRVTNEGRGPDQQAVLEVTLPEAMQPVLLGTSGPSQYKIEGQTIRFEPVATIRGGETLTYRVRARAREPGAARLNLSLTSQGLTQPVTRELTSTIFGER